MNVGCSVCAPGSPEENSESSDSIFWIRLGISLVLAGQSMVFGLAINIASPVYGSATYWTLHGALFASAMVVIALLGPRLGRESWAAFRAGKITVEALFLVTCAGALIGSLLASITGTGSVYYEVVAIVLSVYTVGKRAGTLSRNKVLQEINRYRETFESAREILEGGEVRVTRVEFLRPGARVRIDPGEAVPVDGIILEGTGYLEQSQLTGEPVPIIGRPGGPIHAGSWSVDGTFTVETRKPVGERQIDQILAWVEQARERPSRLQHWADNTIRWFFPLVLTISALTFTGWFLFGSGGWAAALFNAMAVLLVSCPCALGLATPIAIWKGLFRLSEKGLLCRHGEAFDAFARTHRIFFDKTGTLSSAHLVVRDFQTFEDSPTDPATLRNWVASAEKGQEHPIARALTGLVDEPSAEITDRHILPGKGISATVRENGRNYSLQIGTPGNQKSDAATPALPEKVILVQVDGHDAAEIRVEENLRNETEECLHGLRDRGINVDILSGDPNPRWKNISGISVQESLRPEEKRARVQESVELGEEPIFVGDGINDTPAMAAGAASVSIGEGASLPRGTSDAVLLGNDLTTLLRGIDLARRVHRGVETNVRFAVIYNIIGILLAAAGILHPIAAALLMLGSSATVSIRALLTAEFPTPK
ncbi:heavy metal translocating P-type ATPase [Puniceicoccus vermicola]|uniref:Cation-translocating P-type ATPase n=1 Tax=Puniceicoccus vermicola TaxID=388746 RepID=A0A7X1E367_9BACT|nr:cation-translocating P-type ATPase [Puniceicoccus vermicola]MBC2600648.1 cation-translocating P-type ATPase [Puniceicoccus vermicola]